MVSQIYTCRWNLELPSMVEGSILIMSKAGTGTAMFSMGELGYLEIIIVIIKLGDV
jgi:hypothetical protein